jgi:hypothetical protein
MARELVPLRGEALAQTTPWLRVLDVYLDTLDSPHTRRSYERHIAAALETLQVATLAELTGELLAAWRAHVAGAELALGSQAQALAALRSFLKWARLFGAHTLPKDMIGELLKTPGGSVQRPYQVLSEPEAARLLGAATSARDRALLALLLGAGLRAAELGCSVCCASSGSPPWAPVQSARPARSSRRRDSGTSPSSSSPSEAAPLRSSSPIRCPRSKTAYGGRS